MHHVPFKKEFNEWRCAVSPTVRFWEMFLKALSTMLQNIRTERNGKIILDRFLYAFLTRSIYLPTEVEACFNVGFFVIRQKACSFNGVRSDMATEKSVIKDIKENVCIVGLTRKNSALIRWNVPRHIDENRPAFVKRDEQHIDLISHLQKTMVNPFDIQQYHPELLNIPTGIKASKEVQESPLEKIDTGTFMTTKKKLLILPCLKSASTIVDVFDRYYMIDSMKSAERERRSQAAGGHKSVSCKCRKQYQDWKKSRTKEINWL
ncbi:unnamed protein product [Mytilus coruscus]|uniref:Uncharacterized protein n=1 Tax=Mytilus coruscus TaxID=42192 RepID=A0A6J8DXY2_MYTCO|nr:unnamed protein product [Mytilus coruscus]